MPLGSRPLFAASFPTRGAVPPKKRPAAAVAADQAAAKKPLPPGLRRGAYLLPSLFTMGNILLGFYAVIWAINPEHDLSRSAWMIVLAGILDGLDGRIARLTGTESDFGKELDSLADVLTFGATPAYLAYLWGLREFDRLGWLVPLLYLICTATRLARFNVQTKTVDSRSFVGLPSPAAAGAIAAILFWMPTLEEAASPQVVRFGMLVAMALIGLLMISTFRYPSFKKIDLRQRWSYRMVLIFGVLLLVLTYHPDAFFLAIAALYTPVGPLGWLIGKFRRRPPGPAPSELPAAGAR